MCASVFVRVSVCLCECLCECVCTSITMGSYYTVKSVFVKRICLHVRINIYKHPCIMASSDSILARSDNTNFML